MTTISPNAGGFRARIRFALMFLSWLLLAVDFYLYPYLVENRTHFGNLDKELSLPGDLGEFNLHYVRVSLGNFTNREYMKGLCKNSNALAIAIFSQNNPCTNPQGNLAGTRITEQLDSEEWPELGPIAQKVKNSLSQIDQDELRRKLKGLEYSPVGISDVMDLKDRPGDGSLACIRRLYLIKTTQGFSSEAKQELANGLVSMLKSTDSSSKGLIIPPLMVPQTTEPNLYGDFFHSLFDALDASQFPTNIEISLYGNPDTLRSATEALSAEWRMRARTKEVEGLRLYRLDLRLFLSLLPICFLASARRIPMSLKTMTIISCTFATLLLASLSVLATLSDADAGGVVLISIQFVIGFAEALFFPSIVQWGAKELFTGAKFER